SVRIDVKWHNKKFPVEFSNQAELDATTVKQLKEYCQRMTGLETKEMKLSVFGAVMNNDNMPLNVYGIRPGCYITLKQKKHHHRDDHHQEQKQPKQVEQPIHNNKNPLLDNLTAIQTKIKQELTPQVK
ncbi:hypothetical protein K501DRAFT_157249, partial [Backusella circina FSU 941]